MKAVLGVMLTLLLLCTVSFAANIQLVSSQFSGSIYIRSDGTLDPATAPIQQDGDIYTLTDNIAGNITVQRDNVIVDGGGYAILGPEIDYSATVVTIGIYLSNRTNVTIKNVQVKSFINGIRLLNSSKNSIIENNITENVDGIRLDFSSNNTVVGNNITANFHGIHPFLNNKFYHNNFIDNTDTHVRILPADGVNSWTNDYPSGGNYWNNYTGQDTDSDGIGDTPHIIDSNNTDRYPLIAPYVNQPQDLQPDQTPWLYIAVSLMAITVVVIIGFLLFKKRENLRKQEYAELGGLKMNLKNSLIKKVR